MKRDYGVEDICIGNEGTERQKKKEKRDLTRQRESMWCRHAVRTDQQRQASREEEYLFVFMLTIYKLSVKLHAGQVLYYSGSPHDAVSICLVVALTGLPIGYSVIVAITGLPIGYSVIVALTGLPIGYSVIVALTDLSYR